MASAKIIKKRIKSVTNTKKITRTMEMVSTAKSKRALDRVIAARPYALNINELIEELKDLALEKNNPLLRQTKDPKCGALLVITANRGLCGGYVGNICRMAMKRLRELKEQGVDCGISVFGKKGISFFKFKKIELENKYTDFDEKISYADLGELCTDYINGFINEDLDFVEVIYTKFFTATTQRAHISRVLPITLETDDEDIQEDDKKTAGAESRKSGPTLFEPDSETILEAALPLSIRNKFFQCFLESFCAEHIYRRIAMKAATDNAGEMIKVLTRIYNRARQAKITQEIAEIVTGADAIS
jgi:F-type H+-transporting ATPase subunit gamma